MPKKQNAPRSFCLICQIRIYTTPEQISVMRSKYRKDHKCHDHKLILKHWWYTSKVAVKPGFHINNEAFLKFFIFFKYAVLTNFGSWICNDCLITISNNESDDYFKMKPNEKFKACEDLTLIAKLIGKKWKQNLQT